MEEQNVQELDIREIIAVLQRRWWVVAASAIACVLLAFLVTSRMKKVYEATSQIEIKTPMASPGAALMSFGGPSADTFKQTQLALLTNPAVAEQISAELSQTGLHVEPGLVSASLNPTDRRNTDLIDLAVRSTDPKLAQAIANAAAIGFRDYTEGVTQEAAKRDLETMKSRVQQARDSMDRSSRDLSDFQRQYHIVALKEETQSMIDRISAMKTEAAKVEGLLMGSESRTAELQQQLGQQNSAINRGGSRNDFLIAQLQGQLTAAQTLLQHDKQTAPNATWKIKPEEDDVRNLQTQLNAELGKVTNNPGDLGLQEKLQEELSLAQRETVAFRSQYNSLNQQVMAAENAIKELPTRERDFAKLQQNADVARELYQKTLESFQQIDMERLAHPSPISKTQDAVLPKVPISPKPMLNLCLGLFAGLALGLLIALSLEHLDEAVHSEGELRKLAGDLPVLGALPALSGAELSDAENLNPASRGPYRLLWTNIGFSAIDEHLDNMVVTSAVQGEGKSLTSAYLARSAAEEGKQVILVDCDLRRPAQHRNFNVQDALGLCEVLAGKISLDAALIQTDQANLKLLPAGKTLPLNPAVLFKSDRMGQLMEELAERADFVLYDAPPSLVITDALLLGARLQGILQVVESDRTSKEHIKKVIDSVGRARARHLGLVLNKVKKTALGYYGYYYYYQSDETPGANGSKKQRKKRTSAAKEEELV